MEATKESVMRDKFTVRTLRTVTSLLPVALLAPIAGLSCSDNNNSGALPPDVKAIVFLQRMPRGDQGNVFDYQSYAGGGKLVQAVGEQAANTELLPRPGQIGRVELAGQLEAGGVDRGI
jgi:hypothetical protein